MPTCHPANTQVNQCQQSGTSSRPRRKTSLPSTQTLVSNIRTKLHRLGLFCFFQFSEAFVPSFMEVWVFAQVLPPPPWPLPTSRLSAGDGHWPAASHAMRTTSAFPMSVQGNLCLLQANRYLACIRSGKRLSTPCGGINVDPYWYRSSLFIVKPMIQSTVS